MPNANDVAHGRGKSQHKRPRIPYGENSNDDDEDMDMGGGGDTGNNSYDDNYDFADVTPPPARRGGSQHHHSHSHHGNGDGSSSSAGGNPRQMNKHNNGNSANGVSFGGSKDSRKTYAGGAGTKEVLVNTLDNEVSNAVSMAAMTTRQATWAPLMLTVVACLVQTLLAKARRTWRGDCYC